MSILTAVTVGLVMVWGGIRHHTGWQILLSAMILFLGSAATLSVSRVMGRVGR